MSARLRVRISLWLSSYCFVLLLGMAPVGAVDFRRGDSGADGNVDISDVLFTLNYLFVQGETPTCLDAADADDSGAVNLPDAVFTLHYLFTQGQVLPDPGPTVCGPDPTADNLDCAVYDCGGFGDPSAIAAGHLLNRIAYGPTPGELADIQSQGLESFIMEQLDPTSIDESTNLTLQNGLDELFIEQQYSLDESIVSPGALWRYLPGEQEPPSSWRKLVFSDGGWNEGLAGIGYGDDDDTTILTDMRYYYISLYMRKVFEVPDPNDVTTLVLRVDYDDGFVAYLNETEIGRRGMDGNPPAFDAQAESSHEAGTPVEIEVDSSLLVAGPNVLAIQVHNRTIDSNDLTIVPELISRVPLLLPPRTVVRGVDELQRLPHVRGTYARRQLQTILGDFWDNHFSTDFDKLEEYFDDLQDYDGFDAMSDDQAEIEAASVEYDEYQFFTDNALGNFGDLLRFSATSPAMLVFLDNISNSNVEPNENYAREILELHTMGVDNGYTQSDIEELARVFTGWKITKVGPTVATSYPDSALNPPTEQGFQFNESVMLDLGEIWKYYKGTQEPTPDPVTGEVTTEWTQMGYDDSLWLSGPTGIGFGDGDDATELLDMQGNYVSVYLRKSFFVADPDALQELVLEVNYDDGFVAYLNGFEIARSSSMGHAGVPPVFDVTAGNHEANDPEYWNLTAFRELIQPGNNVLAIQVHNRSENNNDLSILPRILEREILPGSVRFGDRSGLWRFRFDPADHDSGPKTLFATTPFEINIPGGGTGVAGVQEAHDIIDGLVSHPSTAEYICIKLIQRFVSDDITLGSAQDQTAPLALRSLLAEMIGAWYSTTPNGNIGTVMATLLDAADRNNAFWDLDYYRAKVKTPLEFVNSTFRILEASTEADKLPEQIAGMGMELFRLDSPDGWQESGYPWISTVAMLERVTFARSLATNDSSSYDWDAAGWLAQIAPQTAEDVVDYFDALLYQGTLTGPERDRLAQFLDTDENGDPAPFAPGQSGALERFEQFVGLVLSLPHWQFQ